MGSVLKLIEVVEKLPCLWEVSSRSSGTMIFNLVMGVVYYGVQSAPTTLAIAEVNWLRPTENGDERWDAM